MSDVFGFDKLSNLAGDQLAEMQSLVDTIAVSDGSGGYKARPGVTSEQVQATLKTIKGMLDIYETVSNDLDDANEDIRELHESQMKARKTIQNARFGHIYMKRRRLRNLMGME